MKCCSSFHQDSVYCRSWGRNANLLKPQNPVLVVLREYRVLVAEARRGRFPQVEAEAEAEAAELATMLWLARKLLRL
jgi:hypothetical protein